MATALAILGVLLGALLLVVLLALALPLRLEVSVEKQPDWRFRALLRPFGRFGPGIVLSGPRKRSAKISEPGKKPRRRSRVRWRGRDPRRLVSPALGLVADVLSRIRLARFDIDARFGLGDPAETGEAYGMLCPILHGIRPTARTNIALEPVFDRPLLAGRADIALSLVPAALIPPLARFGWAAFGPTR